jgi:fused signal recognition particle receptor
VTLLIILAVLLLVAGVSFGVVATRRRVVPAPPPRTLSETVAAEERSLKVEGEVDELVDDEALAEEMADEEEEAAAASLEPPAYRERLDRSRGMFSSLRARMGRSGIDEGDLEDLEASLLGADVGVATTDAIVSSLRARAKARELDDVDSLLAAVRAELLVILSSDADGGPIDRSLERVAAPGRLPVWLFVGVNGVGKTTTIGKLATAEAAAGRRVLLAAGDTFRAAAADQLGLWAERSGAELVRGAEGGDPSAVVFDAIQRGASRKVDLLLADTAGRLHTKVNLIEELKKLRRVADREPGEVTEVLLVLDATTGQNAVAQARQFSEAVGATGVVLTKLDGTARGGVVVAIQRELGLPVKLVGLGEGAGDLVAFDPVAFVDALLAP